MLGGMLGNQNQKNQNQIYFQISVTLPNPTHREKKKKKIERKKKQGTDNKMRQVINCVFGIPHVFFYIDYKVIRVVTS